MVKSLRLKKTSQSADNDDELHLSKWKSETSPPNLLQIHMHQLGRDLLERRAGGWHTGQWVPAGIDRGMSRPPTPPEAPSVRFSPSQQAHQRFTPKPADRPTRASTMQASKTKSLTKRRVILKWLISEIQRLFPSTSSDLTQRQSASSSLEIKPSYLVAPIQINLSAKGRCEGNQQLWINVDNQVINY